MEPGSELQLVKRKQNDFFLLSVAPPAFFFSFPACVQETGFNSSESTEKTALVGTLQHRTKLADKNL